MHPNDANVYTKDRLPPAPSLPRFFAPGLRQFQFTSRACCIMHPRREALLPFLRPPLDMYFSWPNPIFFAGTNSPVPSLSLTLVAD